MKKYNYYRAVVLPGVEIKDERLSFNNVIGGDIVYLAICENDVYWYSGRNKRSGRVTSNCSLQEAKGYFKCTDKLETNGGTVGEFSTLFGWGWAKKADDLEIPFYNKMYNK